MSYVDGFVLVVPKDNLEAYRRLATQAGEVWLEYGALQYVEAVGDDLDVASHGLVPFTQLAGAGPDEVVCFSWILYRDKAHRDAVNAQVMEDERIKNACNEQNMPFDPKRMACGGFSSIVEFKV